MRKIILGLLLLLVICIGAGCENHSKEQMLHDGLQFSQSGNYRGAIVFFKKALEKDPNFVKARFHLADAYLQVGSYEKSEKEFSKVEHQSHDYPSLPLKFAVLYIRTSRTDLAIKKLNEYIEKNPEDSLAYDILGQAYIVAENLSSAKQSFRKAIQLDPKNPSPKLHLAQLLIQLNENDLARQQLEDILSGEKKEVSAFYLLANLERNSGNADKALSIYRELTRLYPDEINALYLTGFLLLDNRDYDEVEKIVENLIEKFPNSPEGFRLKGLLLYSQHSYVEAESELINSVAKGEDLTACYFLGLCYYKLNKLELALNQFQKAVRVSPSFVQARIMVGATLFKQKRLNDAVVELRKAIKINDNNGFAHNILGSVYLAKGMYDEAMFEFDRAIEINPALVDAHVKRGLFRLYKGDSQKAGEELEKALSVAPEIMNNRLLLSSFYLRQQNYSAAIRTIEEGLTGKPEDALLYSYMAVAYFSQKNPEKALAVLEKAKEIKPDYFAPYYNIAAYYSSEGDYDKAIAEYEAVLKIDNKNLPALLTVAALHELKGDDVVAGEYLIRASQTKAPRGYLALSQYYVRTKKLDEAFATLEKGLQVNEKNPELLEMKGRLLLNENKSIKEATDVLKKLEKIKPGSGVPILVRAYIKKGETDKAVVLAEKIIADSPEINYGYLLLSGIYITEKNYAAAEKAIQNGLHNSRDKDFMLKMRLGYINEKIGKTDMAKRIYKEMEKKYPQNSQSTFALALLSDQAGNKREALKLYNEVLEKNDNDIATLNNLAYLYAENYSNPGKALDLAMRAYREKPDAPEIMDTLGYVLLLNGKYDQSFILLKKASTVLSGNPTVNYHMALVCRARNQPQQAAEFLEKALKQGDFPEREAAHKLLAELRN